MKTIAIISAAALAVCASAYAGEGMWTPDNLPIKEVQSKYKFTPTRQWIEHAQKAALRLAASALGHCGQTITLRRRPRRSVPGSAATGQPRNPFLAFLVNLLRARSSMSLS